MEQETIGQDEPDAQFMRGWFEGLLDAQFWFNLPSLTQQQAAMLLCQLNPHEEDPSVGLNHWNGETGSNEYKRMVSSFDALARTLPSVRTLAQWKQYADNQDLKYHSWINLFPDAVDSVQSGAASVMAEIKCKPQLAQIWQEGEILRVISELKYDAKALPKPTPGKSEPKAEVRKLLNLTTKTFDLAWERLRTEGRIADGKTIH